MSDRYKGAILSPTAPTVTPQSAGGIYTSSQQLQYQGQGVWSQAVNNPINNSLRFRNSASAYLNRTGGTSTSRRIHTFSFWTKSSVIGGTRTVISAGPDDSNREVIFIDSNKFTYQVKISNTFYDLETTQVFRDPAAWYHFVVAVDTTQATSSNRVKIYVNGSQITAFGTAVYPPQNADLFFDDSNGSVSYIGALRGYLGSFNYDGYFTEFNFIDGTALTPSSFGTTDAYGIWQPIPYTGAYGTNGFYLPFTDNSALTTSSNVGLGKDFSGNGNYWVTNNISITAGSTYDSMKDVPTNTNSNTANYATLNPTVPKTYCTQTDGNLKSAGTSSTDSDTSVATIGVSSGKWYWEDKIGTISSAVYPILGAGRNILSSFVGAYPGIASVGGFGLVVGNGNIVREGTTVTTVTALVANDVVGFALDLSALTCAIYKNNSLIYTVTGLTAGTYYPMANEYSSSNSTHNYGQQPFSYTPPSGFYPLNTYNLPTPTILDGDQYFDAVLYTGTGSSQTISSLNFSPDFVWIKERSADRNHRLQDSVRGANKSLRSNGTQAEATDSADGYVSAFTSNGFTTAAGSSSILDVGESSGTYVAWCWDANGSGSSNTQGTITSTVSANTTAGFSIATLTTQSSGTGTFGHGLGVAPSLVICKYTSTTSNWFTWHTGIAGTSYLLLNTTAATTSNSAIFSATPTSTVVNLGTAWGGSGQIVAYCFAAVAGYSAFGSYTGNGSTDGPFVFTGFRPRFVMIKRTDNVGDWYMLDTSRDPYNLVTQKLMADLSAAENGNGESTSTNTLDILSNGFKMRSTNTASNTSGATYIYAAFAENPFKISRAR